VTCSTCGTENEAGRKFCGECGQRLVSACPSCGSSNAPGTKFCGECGALLADPPAGAVASVPRPVSTPATERRLVSVLFADLVGFTTLAEGRDAEDVRELLARYFDACREVIERYGGAVEKFIGDAVMAVWGTPVAQEDDAERAVRAALDLVEAVQRLGSSAGTNDLGLRAAVHTGEAVVTIGATGMGMVAGDLVNTASRLQSVAAPGTVLVGESTRRAASEAIGFEEAGEQALKGKVSPVPAFRAVRVVAQRGGIGRSEALEPPFVGRQSELQLIKDFYHATAREHGPRLVSVIGQAGIGKSRLAWEFLKYIDGVTEVVYWHQGRSPAYGEGISFWALGEMVRMRIGVGEGADEVTTRECLRTTLEEFVTDLDERERLEPALLHLLGIGEAPAGERGPLFVAWRTFFERIADHGPVVMVFEDLQWADDGLLDFIEELLAWSRGHPLYLITLARAELLDRRPTWGAGQRNFTSLGLAPLEAEEMRAMLAGLVPGLPDDVVHRIAERSEGIPLYAVETIRMLLHDGRVERKGDDFVPVGNLAELAVPESLHALIAARIDALQDGARAVLQDASVLGHSFTIAALGAVVRGQPDEVEPMLRHLVQRELLTIDDDPRSPERGQYRFVQGLLREVAYGTLSRDDRRARHLAAARYHESLGDDELSGVLAQHYVDAYRAHPDGPEGAAVAAQARVALRGAAQRATGLGSHRLALGYLESALEVTSEPADELELRTVASQAAVRGGALEPAERHARRTIELATEIGDVASRRRSTSRLAEILTEGHLNQARDLLRAAYHEPDLKPEDPGFVEIAETLAKTEMRLLHDVDAIEIANVALPAAEAAGLERLAIELLITRGVSLSNLGRPTEAVVTLTGALELARRRDLHDAAHRSAINLSYALDQDDPRRGFEVAREALELAHKVGNVWAIRYLMGNAAIGAMQVGEWDWAMEQVTMLLDGVDEPGERIWYGMIDLVIRAYRGERVDEDAARLRAEGREFDDPQYIVMSAIPSLEAALAAGRLGEVIAIADDLLPLGIPATDVATTGFRAALWGADLPNARRMRGTYLEDRRGRRWEAARMMMAAGVAQLEGRIDEARRTYADALAAFRPLGLRFEFALCALDVIVSGAMEPDDRRRLADEARTVFTELRATPYLERLDAALNDDDASGPTAPVTEATPIEARPTT
jgi:class 3 adenylate cyclase/tetratricopeptide (TPR) repeat protein